MGVGSLGFLGWKVWVWWQVQIMMLACRNGAEIPEGTLREPCVYEEPEGRWTGRRPAVGGGADIARRGVSGGDMASTEMICSGGITRGSGCGDCQVLFLLRSVGVQRPLCRRHRNNATCSWNSFDLLSHFDEPGVYDWHDSVHGQHRHGSVASMLPGLQRQ